jgi:hypothetical protein
VGLDGKRLEIVHRDVTPQNVIVTFEGAVKLLDFGIAKASNRFGETRSGTLKGNLPYMSPEQCIGDQLDRRSDIFSTGILLYELALGRRLFHHKSDFEILKQIVEGTVPSPREIDPNYPEKLSEIVMRALHKEKEQRFQTAREMQVALEAFVRDAHLYPSAIALQQYIEQLFDRKVQAWQAKSRGESLEDHLRHTAVEIIDDDDMEELTEEQLAQEQLAKSEREKLRAELQARDTQAVPPPAGLLQPSLADDEEEDSDSDTISQRRRDLMARKAAQAESSEPVPLAPPRWNRFALPLGALALVGAGAGVTLAVRKGMKSEQAAAPAIVAPAPFAATPELPSPPPVPPAESPPPVAKSARAAGQGCAGQTRAAAEGRGRGRRRKARRRPGAARARRRRHAGDRHPAVVQRLHRRRRQGPHAAPAQGEVGPPQGGPLEPRVLDRAHAHRRRQTRRGRSQEARILISCL